MKSGPADLLIVLSSILFAYVCIYNYIQYRLLNALSVIPENLREFPMVITEGSKKKKDCFLVAVFLGQLTILSVHNPDSRTHYLKYSLHEFRALIDNMRLPPSFPQFSCSLYRKYSVHVRK